MGGITGLTIGGWGGRYKLHRPYVRGFATNWPHGTTVTLDPPEFKLTLTEVAPGWSKVIRFEERFYDWTSNGYTMDWILTLYNILDPSDENAGNGENFVLGYKVKPGTREWWYTIDVGFWTDWYYLPLPPAPTTWFVPLP